MIDKLASCEGTWQGTSQLQLDAEAGTLTGSPSTAIVSRVASGKFVRIDYKWSHEGQAHDGSYLIGHTAKTGEVTVYWVDSFHMGSSVLASTGTADDSGIISVLGAYAAPPGPDWGWRTIFTPDGDALRIVMNNIWPEGREDLAVDATYTRV